MSCLQINEKYNFMETLCLERGIRKTEEPSSLFLQSFLHWSLMSIRKTAFTASLKTMSSITSIAICWADAPVFIMIDSFLIVWLFLFSTVLPFILRRGGNQKEQKY